MAEAEIDAVVAGAGVVGLAVACALARGGKEVLVLDAAEGVGRETSSRNSEVIHAGLYYAPGSLKARTCVDGRRLLYDYLVARGVPHRRCGKLIVACDDRQTARLESILERARTNGVEDIRLLSAAEAVAMEPQLRCSAALLSPATGIMDSHAYMLSLQAEAEEYGAIFAFRARIEGGEILHPEGCRIEVAGPDPMSLRCRLFVNCAGLWAQDVARRIEGFPEALIPPRRLAKGVYFQLQGRSPFSRLVYPAPEPGGLGVHLTLDLSGQARFGPDVEWVEAPDYAVDPRRAEAFYAAVRKYWPGLRDGALVPAYAGVRPKIVGPGEPDGDFLVLGPAQGTPAGHVHLFGIESPGLTASLALAREVSDRLSAGEA